MTGTQKGDIHRFSGRERKKVTSTVFSAETENSRPLLLLAPPITGARKGGSASSQSTEHCH
jgi:hypothetical protein